jgi:hypothetical protein
MGSGQHWASGAFWASAFVFFPKIVEVGITWNSQNLMTERKVWNVPQSQV